MTLYHILEAIYQRLETEAHTSQLVLLHPHSRYRSAFTAFLLRASPRPVLYYALSSNDTDLPSFLNSLIHGLSYQHPTFGRHLNLLRPNLLDSTHPSAEETDILLQTLVKDLREIGSDPFYLILDEYDRSDESDSIQQFLEKLIDHLPPQCQIILNSRTLPRLPWIASIIKGRATILKDDELLRRQFHVSHEEESLAADMPRLDVVSLGPGFVHLNDQPIDSWEGHLPRLLFFFALDRPVVTRTNICRAFWPELTEEQAVNVFHVTKRRLHKALKLDKFDVLAHQGSYYQLNPQLDVSYDASEFATALLNGRDSSYPDRAGAWSRAVELYGGHYLHGQHDHWIVQRRADYQVGYLEALRELADCRESEGRVETALQYYQRALTEAPWENYLHQRVMRAYVRLGRRSEAATHYQRLMEDSHRNNVTIADDTHRLYYDLMS